MIGFFKDPYPDELLYSACARFSEKMKYPNLTTAIWELFGSNASAVVDLPTKLDNLIAVLPPGHRYTADYFIDNHTLFPLYSPFLPFERAALIRKLMRDSGENHLRERLGIKANGIQLPDYLRFCPVCIGEDRSKFGEPYWHRLHQITGIEVCPLHEVFLELSAAPWCAQRNHNKFITCDRAVHNTPSRSLDLTNPQHSIFLKLARDVAWLLGQSGLASGPRVLRDRYHNILLKYGYAYYNGRIRTAKLIKGFLEVYSPEFLASLHSQLENSYGSWLPRLLHPHKTTTIQSPLRHLLLITFLGYTAEEFFTSFEEYKPFAKGPWPCLNHASEHFGELRITECRMTDNLVKKKLGRPMGTFSCSCGFVYIRVGPDNSEADRFRIDNVQSYGPVWEQTLRDYWSNLDITVQEISEKLGVSHLTVTRHAIRLQLPMNITGARAVSKKVIDQFRNPRLTWKNMLQSYRAEWLAVLQANPDASRQQLMEMANFLYLWLRKNDSQWIEEHLPSPRKFTSTAPRYEWENIDSELSAKVEAVAIRLKNLDGRPVRISITAIIREVGHKSWLESRLHRIPQTAEALSKNIETLETWGIRLVKWAEEGFVQEAICPTRHSLMVKAGLRNRTGMFPRVQSAINDALDRLHHRMH